MIPKTRIQKLVAGLSPSIPPITDKHKAWVSKKCFDKFAVVSRKTLYCLECGHSWKNTSPLANSVLGPDCPECHFRGKLVSKYSRLHSQAAYFAVLTTRAEMQVVRMFWGEKHMKKRMKPSYWFCEVMQHWVLPSGKVITMSKSVNGFSFAYDSWRFASDLEVRPKSFHFCKRYDIAPYKICPRGRILPIMKRNGFSGHFYGLPPHRLFSIILLEPIAETLLKAGQIKLLEYCEQYYYHYNKVNIPDRILDIWPSIKICIRSGYIINDTSIWFDYLGFLSYFGKDLRNAVYVCPPDLQLAHDHLMRKKRDIERKLRIKELREKIEADQPEYLRQKGKFLKLSFSENEITVKTLETVEEFLEEGDKLNHCAFTGSYFKKPDSLVMSARIGEKPIETIEISISRMIILQSRGYGNMPSQYHDRILKLVKENLPRIEACKHPRRNKKSAA